MSLILNGSHSSEMESTHCRHGREWYRCCDPESNMDSWTYRPIKRVPPLDVKGFKSGGVKPGSIYSGSNLVPTAEMEKELFDMCMNNSEVRPFMEHEEPLRMAWWMPLLMACTAALALWIVYRVAQFCYAALMGWFRA